MPLNKIKLKIAFKGTKVNPLYIDAPQQLKSDKMNPIKILIYPYRLVINVFFIRDKNIILLL
jgi:hypothetical protein